MDTDPDEPAGHDDPAGDGGEPRRSGRHEQPTLPTVSRDETDVGWGDEPGERDEDWYRRERPPHHE